MRFDRNDYSVPTAFAHHDVTASAGSKRSASSSAPTWWPPTPRCWDKEQVCFDPRHYLALLERKPGALDLARPLEGWSLPECFAVLRRRLEADLGHAGTTGVHQGAAPDGEGHARRAHRRGRRRPSPSGPRARTPSPASSCTRTERPVGLFSLDGHPHLKEVAVEAPDLTAYRALTAIG